MRVNGHMETVGRGRPLRSASGATAVEKASAASHLTREHPGESRPRHRTAPSLHIERVCQDETACFDPLHDAPKLRPAFVAQLLGQVMAGNGTGPSTRAAYRPVIAAHTGRLIDRRG